MKKNPKESNSIRLAGQRSITSSLASRSSHPSVPGNGGKISLSDFLSKKLHKSSVLPQPSKDKEKLSSSLFSPQTSFMPFQNGDKKIVDATEKTCPLDKSIFDKFKPVGNEVDEECLSSCNADDVDSLNVAHGDNVRESKKRGAAFDHGSEYVTGKRRVIVLGDDPTPCSSINKTAYKKSEQSVPVYNHYANGKGWWDSNMEGVDNEEVGASEVWEGVGSTTLGGLDWH